MVETDMTINMRGSVGDKHTLTGTITDDYEVIGTFKVWYEWDDGKNTYTLRVDPWYHDTNYCGAFLGESFPDIVFEYLTQCGAIEPYTEGYIEITDREREEIRKIMAL